MHAVMYVSLYRSPAGLTCSPPGKPWFVTVISIVLFPADRYGVTLQESWVPNWKLFAFASRQVVATLFISTEYVLSVAISRIAEVTVPVRLNVLTKVNVSSLSGLPLPPSPQIHSAPAIKPFPP